MSQGYYKGWIAIPSDYDIELAKKQLKEHDIRVGEFDLEAREFVDCIVSEIAMEQLDGLLENPFIWGLKFEFEQIDTSGSKIDP